MPEIEQKLRDLERRIAERAAAAFNMGQPEGWCDVADLRDLCREWTQARKEQLAESEVGKAAAA